MNLRSIFKKVEDTTIIARQKNVQDISMPWYVDSDRMTTWLDLTDMDDGYGIISRGLDVLTDFSLIDQDDNSGIGIRGGKTETKILEDLIKRTRYNEQLQEITRSMILYGDYFVELIYDTQESKRIIAIKQIPISYLIEENRDKYGKLMTGNPEESIANNGGIAAYDQYDEYCGKVIGAFWDYQIVKFSFGYPDRYSIYTRPILKSIIPSYKRHVLKLDTIALYRLTKAFDIIIHKIPTPINATPAQKIALLKSYIENQTQDTIATFDTSASKFQVSKREKPQNVVTDFYLSRNYTPDGKVVDADIEVKNHSMTGLREIGDIELDIKFYIAALGVPDCYLNNPISPRAFVDKSSDKADEAFAMRIKGIQAAIRKGTKTICDRELLMHGIDPDTAKYEIVLPMVRPSSTRDNAQTTHIRTQTAQMQIEMGIPLEIVARKTLGYTPEETKLWIKNTKKEEQE